MIKLKDILNEETILVRRVDSKAVETFLKKYPKVKQIMTTLAQKNTDLMRGYKAFLKFKDKQEDYLGGRAEQTTSTTFGSKTFYKYDWNNLKGHWPEVYQYIYTLRYGGLDGAKVESVNEGIGKEAMGIAGFTGTRGIAVQKFIDDFNLNAKKLFNFIAKGKLKDRMDFATAISGKSGNKYQGNFVGMFGEGTINEDSETKRLEMLIKNLEETIKLLVQQLKDNKSLPSNKKENIKKSIAVNLDLINYYKKWLKDYQAAANESLVNEDGPCWKGYKQVGMKDKGGRQVPNCVPNESIVKEDIPTKEVSPAEKAKNINNRIKVLRAQIGAQKDPVKRAKIQSTLRNAMQTLSKNRGGSNK